MIFDPSSVPFRFYAAAVALATIVVPAVLGIAYLFLVPTFMPTETLSPAMLPLSLIVALLYLPIAFAVFAPEIAKSWNNRKFFSTLKFTILLAIAPAVGVMGVLAVVGGPLPYLMHMASDSQPLVKEFTIYKAGRGSRVCRNSITLANDRFVFRQRLCRQPGTLIKALSSGGSVRLTGLESAYGFSVAKTELAQ